MERSPLRTISEPHLNHAAESSVKLIGRRASQLAESTRAAQFEWRVLCARLAARRDLGGGSAAADGAGIDRLVADELF